jgi:hypothetical protein
MVGRRGRRRESSLVYRIARISLLALVLVPGTSIAQIKTMREARPTPRSTSAKSAPVSLKECERFGLSLEECARTRDVKQFEASVDWDQLFASAVNGIPAQDKVRRTFKDASTADLRGAKGLATSICNAVTVGGSFRFLRAREENGSARALFRWTHADGGGFDYVEFTLADDGNGGSMAVDIDVCGDGGSVAQKLRRYFLSLSSDASKNLADKLRGNDRAYVQHKSEVESLQDCFARGENKKALELFAALPPELKKESGLLHLRLDAARAVSNEEFQSALEEARTLRPNDPTLELVAFDHFQLTRRADDAMNSLQRLDEAIGGDPYIDWLRANLWRVQGDAKQAREACVRALAKDPKLVDAHWTLLALSVEEPNYDATLAELKRMDATFDIDWSDLPKTPAYAEFVKSPQWAEWKLWLARKR